jgi:hypothetical protein
MRSRTIETSEHAISILMDALALVLIKLDITPSRLNEIARSSFVKAAASADRQKSSGQPHLARIASLTGLTRTEVKRIVNAGFTHQSSHNEHLPRALRVLTAWKASRKYLKGGSSRRLPATGKSPSFESLCKEFSGDIPHTTIAAELLARGLIRVGTARGKEYVYLVGPKPSVNPGDVDTIKFIASLLSSVATSERVLVRRRQRVPLPKNLAPAYFQNSIATRVAAFVDDLPLESKRNARTNSREQGLEVFAVVSKTQKRKQ